jgi:hypothetical protein
MGFIQTIITDFEEIFDKIKEEGEAIITDANQVVNGIMAFTTSPTGVELITLLETIFPKSDPTINAILNALATISKEMNWATNESGKTDEQIFQDAWTYLKSLVGSTKASQLNSFASLISEIIAGIKNVILTIQQILSLQQGAHAPLVTV